MHRDTVGAVTPHSGRSQLRVAGILVMPEPTALGCLRLHGIRLFDHALQALASLPGCDVVVIAAHRASSPLRLPPHDYDVVVVHDPLCPLVPATTLEACVRAVGPSGAVVGVLPVTDTVKRVEGAFITSTMDRDNVRLLAAPVAFAASLLPAVQRWLPRGRDLGDLPRLADALADTGSLLAVQVPAYARRVADAEDVDVLDCLEIASGV